MKLIAVTDRGMIEGAAGVALAAEYQDKKLRLFYAVKHRVG